MSTDTADSTPPPRCRRRSRLLAVLVAVIRRVDAVRIRAHLRRTERALRAADTDHLDADRRRRRHRALDALRRYRRRGEFPTNDAEPRRAAQFVGANGVPCAVAALLLADGAEELVDRIAATDNAVRIENLDDGPLLDWLDRNGLSRLRPHGSSRCTRPISTWSPTAAR
ncbi:hypothetical protein [Halosimplex salinum]|uniref:hypothetical protein n=1 Tax=Halosimplex salinum TaxID=1710538 RepID=UPI000F48DE66|nr:hypothetical protein [Halosimplex salinum]